MIMDKHLAGKWIGGQDMHMGKVWFSIKNKIVYLCDHDHTFTVKKLGEGGTADVYQIPVEAFHVPMAIKIYSEKILTQKGSAIRPFLSSLIAFRESLSDEAKRVLDRYTVWPQRLVYDYDNDKVCGFIMRLIPKAFFTEIRVDDEIEVKESNLDFILHGEKFRRKRGLPVLTNIGRSKLICDLILVVAVLHGKNYVLGDLSPKNIFVAVDGNDQRNNQILFIDTDSFKHEGDVHPLQQPHTPNWIPPECSEARIALSKYAPNAHQNQIANLTIDAFFQNRCTDIYKICLAIIRLYHDGERAALISTSTSAYDKLQKEIGDEFANYVRLGLSEKPEDRPTADAMLMCLKKSFPELIEEFTIQEINEGRDIAGEYSLLVLILGEQSEILRASQEELYEFTRQYFIMNVMLVLIFLGKKANRVIAGQQINRINNFPSFDDSEGSLDIVKSTHEWICEAQANVKSDNINKNRTAVFIDVSDEIITRAKITSFSLLGESDETDYYTRAKTDGAWDFKQVSVTSISKLKSLSKTGDSDAQYKLGLAYANGGGVEIDLQKAKLLFFQASIRGNINALYALVDFFDEPDKHSCEKAAEFGHLKAQWLIGKAYYTEYIQGTGKDLGLSLEKAEYWLRNAAEGGNQEAKTLHKEILVQEKL